MTDTFRAGNALIRPLFDEIIYVVKHHRKTDTSNILSLNLRLPLANIATVFLQQARTGEKVLGHWIHDNNEAIVWPSFIYDSPVNSSMASVRQDVCIAAAALPIGRERNTKG